MAGRPGGLRWRLVGPFDKILLVAVSVAVEVVSGWWLRRRPYVFVGQTHAEAFEPFGRGFGVYKASPGRGQSSGGSKELVVALEVLRDTLVGAQPRDDRAVEDGDL